jgi:hypothetical protein
VAMPRQTYTAQAQAKARTVQATSKTSERGRDPGARTTVAKARRGRNPSDSTRSGGRAAVRSPLRLGEIRRRSGREAPPRSREQRRRAGRRLYKRGTFWKRKAILPETDIFTPGRFPYPSRTRAKWQRISRRSGVGPSPQADAWPRPSERPRLSPLAGAGRGVRRPTRAQGKEARGGLGSPPEWVAGLKLKRECWG